MNAQFVDIIFQDGCPDTDMLYYLLGVHCWCGHNFQDLSKYNMYDVMEKN